MSHSKGVRNNSTPAAIAPLLLEILLMRFIFEEIVTFEDPHDLEVPI